MVRAPSPRRRVVAVATVTLLLSAMTGPTVSAAIDWRAEVPIARSEAGMFHTDASYRDGLTVIAWQVDGEETEALHVAISRDAGRGTFATRRVAEEVSGMAVAACGKDAFVAYRERRSDGRLRLRLARVPSDGGAIERVTIRPSVPVRGTLDVACRSASVTIAWTERVDSRWHAMVRLVRLADLGRSRVADLGVAHRFRVAAAASGDRAYMAWSDTTGLRFRRFVDADGRPPAPQRLTTTGRAPMLADDGAGVVVGYTSASDPEVRVSRDRGRTFPAIWGYGLDPGDSSFLSIALEGQRIVGTVAFTYLDHEPFYHRIMSRDLGGRWTQTSVGSGVVEPLDGFLVAATGTKLAETYVRADDETGGWELVFRRER